MASQNRQGARRALLVVVLLLVGAVMGLRTRVAWDTACTVARRQLPEVLGLDVGIGQCELDPLGQKVVIRGLSLFAPGTDTPLFAADLAEVQLGLSSPFSGKLALDLVKVQRPRVALDLSKPSKTSRDTPSTCALEPLERLRISRLALSGAQVRLALPDGRRVEVMDLDMGWKERWGIAEFDVEARRGVVDLGPSRGELALGRLVLSGGLDVDAESVELNRAEVALDETSVSLSGRVEQLCDPVLALDAQVFLPLRTLTQARLLPKQASGHVWSRLTVNGRPSAPNVAVEVSASNLAYERFGPTSLTARLHYAGERVRVEKLTVPVGSGRVEVQGTVRLTPNLPVELEVQTFDASFGRILAQAGVEGSWVDFPATTTGRLSGTLLPRPQLAGDVDLRTGRFVLATHAFDAPEPKGITLLEFDRGRVQAQVKLLPDRVSFTGAQVESGGSKANAEVTLFYDSTRGLEVRGQGELDLSDFGAIAELPWAGSGGTSFTVVGPYADVKVDASMSMRDFTFWGFGLGVVQGKVTYHDKVINFPALSGQKGRTQYFGKAALTFGSTMHARAEVNVPQGRTEDLLDIIAGLHPNIAVMQGTIAGVASGRVEIDSPVDRFEGLAAFDFKDTTYYGRRMGSGSTRLRFVDGKEMVLERTVLEGPLGKSWVEGTFTFAGGLDYRFGGEDLSLAEAVGQEFATRMGLQGTLTLAGTVSGNSTLPIVEATLTSPRVAFADRDLGPMHLVARMEGRDLDITGKPFRDASGFVEMKVKEPFPFEASVMLALPEIRPLLPASTLTQGMSGALSGILSAQGNIRNWEAVQLSATVDQLTLARGGFRGANEGPIALSYVNGRLEVQSFAFRGPDTELSATGWLGPRAMDLTVRGALDMRVLESLVPDLERTGGRMEFQAQASGLMDKPSLAGEANLSDGRMALRGRPVTLRNLFGQATFTEQGVLLKGFRGLLNEGSVRASGEIALKQLVPDRLSLVAELENVTYRFSDDLPVTASGDLQLTGTPDAMLLAGDVDILRLRYQKGLELDSVLKNLGRRSGVLPTTADKPREFLTYDVRVHLRDVRVDNNLARARMLGDLRLTGTNVRPGLLGRVEAAEGSQAFFRNNQFAISQAQVEFRDRYGFDLVFDVRAQTQVREYTLKLHAFGPPSDPQVLLSSEPSLAEGDVLSLLTLGVTSTDRDTAASASAGLAAEALFNVSGLDRQVKRFLPRNAILKDLSFQISTTYNDATRQAEPTAQLESKILSDQLKIGMTQPVSGRGTRARAEYRFDNRLSAQAQWDNENNEASFGNLGLELKLSWEVE
ncbi:translocation/assembly module TamB domain-containing protein [Hyalangium rubrum]|uniref:Translocation/assembly module TamB domain-containing protein n=1 Tax=Hyalangium rubrum TaxID=3103134 RepID=A0ABU5H5V9_9BACT|nr:translocation/assembly module TamB domain-containing protein [Hyalangium sp. s54d21]MDY7228474.1 translocation/assembly module TamB domain-containing protein [Hyalangium sp. s54d21]